MTIETIGVVGAGAWGTALAINAARAGRRAILWGRDSGAVRAMEQSRQNATYLPGIPLDPSIRITADIDDMADTDAILLVVPAQTVGKVAGALCQGVQPLILCAKGLDRSSDRRLTEVIRDVSPDRPLAVLSGPNFAREVALALPAAATLACSDEEVGRSLAEAMSHYQFRLYWTDDMIGVEIGGAVKNVLAIAAGIVLGRGLGENAKAALITRGLAELTRLGDMLGARRETLMGLAGLGDLLLTAGSLTSRNMAFGHAIGTGADPIALQRSGETLVEGVATARTVVRLADRCQGVDVPICQAVDTILAGELDIGEAIRALMTRPLKAENDR